MSRLRLLAVVLLLVLPACTLPDFSDLLDGDIPTQLTPLPPTPSVPAFTHSTPRFQVFILNSLTTCLVGNEFASGNVCAGTECGDCSCTWEQHDPPAPQVGVPLEKLDELPYSAYAHKICVDVTLTDEEVDEIIADMDLVKELVYEWTDGALDLQMDYTVLSHTFTGFTAPEFVIGPFEIDDDLLDAFVSTDTDFVYVVSGYQGSREGPAPGSLVRQFLRRVQHRWCHVFLHSIQPGSLQFRHHCWKGHFRGAHPRMDAQPGLGTVLRGRGAGPVPGRGSRLGCLGACQLARLRNRQPGSTRLVPEHRFLRVGPGLDDCNSTDATIGCHSGEGTGRYPGTSMSSRHTTHGTCEFNGNFCADGRQDFSETGIDTGWPCP